MIIIPMDHFTTYFLQDYEVLKYEMNVGNQDMQNAK